MLPSTNTTFFSCLGDHYVETLQLTATIGWLTYRKVSADLAAQGGLGTAREEVFLAGKGLSWVVVAGSITLTNLSTDQLVGMNGNQMVLLAWWELAAVVGLVILAKVILPVYYRYDCTTTTELLEKRYHDRRIRALIGWEICSFLSPQCSTAALCLFKPCAVSMPTSTTAMMGML